MGHRPMYCSNNDQDDCTLYESLVSGCARPGPLSPLPNRVGVLPPFASVEI